MRRIGAILSWSISSSGKKLQNANLCGSASFLGQTAGFSKNRRVLACMGRDVRASTGCSTGVPTPRDGNFSIKPTS